MYKGAIVLNIEDVLNNNFMYINYYLYPSLIQIQTANRKAVSIEWVVSANFL